MPTSPYNPPSTDLFTANWPCRYDCLVINRRRIPAGDFTPDDLPKLYPVKGKPHPVLTCFVFRRELVPQMELGSICIGISFVEATLAHNLFALAGRPKLYDKEFLTFHLGMEIFKNATRCCIGTTAASFSAA